MERMKFRSLPLIVRIATLATFGMAWILFEELVIDRQGLDDWLPLYRVGNFCPYDAAVLALLVLAWIRLHR